MKRNEVKAQAARYLKFVEWSDEDKVFVGRCPSLFSGAVHGPGEALVYAELCETVEEWIGILHKDGLPLPATDDQKKYSGRIVLRMDPALHRRLAAKAQAEGESLNSFMEKKLIKA